MRFYVDTSIWLNLFKKEGDESKGIPYWKLAEIAITQIMLSRDHSIVYSGVVLRELQLKLSNAEYEKKKWFFEEKLKLTRIDVKAEDMTLARKLESKYQFSISFYDLIHIALCKREGFALVTRDRCQIQKARENSIQACRPEELELI